MKKYLLFVLIGFLLLVNKVSEAQYFNLIDTNKLWNYYDTYFGPNPHYTHLYRFITDTIISGKKYYIPEITVDSINWFKENYFFREEDSTKRVYILYNNNEGLLYDFSLNTGDSVTILNTLSTFNTPVTIHVVSIDSIQIDGFYRKILNTDYYTWIESIGDLLGLKHPGDMSVGVTLTLVCYYENNSVKYINPDYDSCFNVLLNIEENQKDPIIFSYDTKNGFYILKSITTIDEITVYDMLGRKLRGYFPKSLQFEVNTSTFNKGLYFLTVKIENRVFNIKIVMP